MTHITICDACPNSWQCNGAGECLNRRVIENTSRLQLEIAKGLDAYDAKRALIVEQRAKDPAFAKPKELDKKPVCWHNYSAAGICLSCGYWKQS